MKIPGEIFNANYEKKIINLDQQNKEMRARLVAYEKNQSNWETLSVNLIMTSMRLDKHRFYLLSSRDGLLEI